jgi:hypothetical protein
MHFLLYLSPEGTEIYNMISRKVRVVENTPICRKYDIFGWYQNTTKTMVFCTDKIVSKGNPKYYVNETLFHEAAHVAQACRQNMKEVKPFGISPTKMHLSDVRKNDLKLSYSIGGNEVLSIEREAYWMEDKPDQVKYVLQKYCF